MKGDRLIIVIGFIFYGLTVLFWIAMCARSLMQDRFDLPLFLGAALWILWFAAMFRRYRSREKDDDE